MNSKFLYCELDKQKELINKLTLDLEKAKQNYILLQKKAINSYKLDVIRYYMAIWDNINGKFPKDEELTKAIFYLAGLDISDFQDNRKPKIEIKILSNNKIKLSYFNNRLETWIELKIKES